MRTIIRGGRVLDPASSTDGIRDILVEDGIIKEVAEHISTDAENVIEAEGLYVMPGLIDLHVHAPQYPFRGLGMDQELIDWLNTHTFPEEESIRIRNTQKRRMKFFWMICFTARQREPASLAPAIRTLHSGSWNRWKRQDLRAM